MNNYLLKRCGPHDLVITFDAVLMRKFHQLIIKRGSPRETDEQISFYYSTILLLGKINLGRA